MNHDLNTTWIYKFSGFIALLENYIKKDTKNQQMFIYSKYAVTAVNFHLPDRFQRIVYYMPNKTLKIFTNSK